MKLCKRFCVSSTILYSRTKNAKMCIDFLPANYDDLWGHSRMPLILVKLRRAYAAAGLEDFLFLFTFIPAKFLNFIECNLT